MPVILIIGWVACGLSLALFIFFFVMKHRDYWGDWEIGIFIDGFLLFVLFLICMLSTEYGLNEYDNMTEIASIERNSEVSGHFTLGCGYIKSEMYYFAYEKVSDDTYSLLKIDASGCLIKEDDSVTPRYIEKKSKWEDKERYFIVPVGTITKEFHL